MIKSAFKSYTWFVLAFNIFVIIWGGLVSASGSGDGCGDSWPLCSEVAAAATSNTATFIEFFHRATSGLALLAVFLMLFWAWKLYGKGSSVWRWSALSTLFIIGEAAIGAILVIFRFVASNESLARAFLQPIHLLNTFLLVSSLTLTVWFVQKAGERKLDWRVMRPFLLGIGLLFLVGTFGAIASLASTLYPSNTFFEGVAKDFSADSHYLIRLRVWHPIFAVAASLFIAWQANRQQLSADNQRLTTFITATVIAQLILGALNAILVAPILIQLAHLLLADLLLIAYTFLAAETSSSPVPSLQSPTSSHA